MHVYNWAGELDSRSHSCLRTFGEVCGAPPSAFDRAGISHIDWIAEGFDAIDKGRSRPPAFENGMVSADRLTTDPRIIRTISPGLPGSPDIIPQYQALSARVPESRDPGVQVHSRTEQRVDHARQVELCRRWRVCRAVALHPERRSAGA